MVLGIEVGGKVYLTPQDIIDNSQTLTDLLGYISHDDNENYTLSLTGVNVNVWNDYMTITNFLISSNLQMLGDKHKLHFNSPVYSQTKNALTMMDYLNNYKQLRQWFIVFYDYYNITLNVVKQLLSHTSFTLADINPCFRTKTISDIIPVINSVHIHDIHDAYIDHIIHTLYDDNVLTTYKKLSSFSKLKNLYNNNVNIKDGIFIIISKHALVLDMSINTLAKLQHNIPPDNKNMYIIEPEIISPRIATYYPNENIFSVDYQGKSTLLVTTHYSPFLCKLVIRGKTYYACRYDDRDSLKPITKDQLPKTTDYIPRSGYKFPINPVFEGMYDLYTYNPPSTKNRDYYVLLIYELDPIAKILYAFSL